METIQSEHVLRVHLEPPRPFATLGELKAVAEQLQRAVNAVARSITDEPEIDVPAEITGTRIASLHLEVRPRMPEGLAVDSAGICLALIRDINDVGRQHYRPGLTPSLLQHYRALVNTLGPAQVRVRLAYHDEQVTIDEAFRRRFEVATKPREARGVQVIGRIETLNIHSRPYEGRLFPTQPGADAITCRFEEGLLGPITDAIRDRTLVRVTGTGRYAPVGLYPTSLTLAAAPEALTFDAARLRARVRRMRLVPAGMTGTEFLAMNRRAAGFEEAE